MATGHARQQEMDLTLISWNPNGRGLGKEVPGLREPHVVRHETECRHHSLPNQELRSGAASKAEGQRLTSGTVQAYFPLKTQPQCDSKRTLRTGL